MKGGNLDNICNGQIHWYATLRIMCCKAKVRHFFEHSQLKNSFAFAVQNNVLQGKGKQAALLE